MFNLALEMKSAKYKVDGKALSKYDIQKMLPRWKTTNVNLAKAPSSALVYSLRDLDQAFQNFFRRVKKDEKPGYPKFKSRYHRQSYKVQVYDGSIVDDMHVKLPKLGVVDCRVHRKVEGRIVSATISRSPTNKYYVTFGCLDIPEPEMPLGQNEVLGIDVGIKDLMVRSDGVRVPNNKNLSKSEKKLRREQRRLSRKKKGSKNWEKQRVKVAKVHERVSNQRRDAIHKATMQAVRDSRAIAVEDLNVKGMTKNHHLAKAVTDASMGEMHRQLQYKCEWYGRDFVKVDRWYPSSKTCGACGHVYRGLTLSERSWTCPECGTVHDRDINAARNIAREGTRILREG